MGEPDPDGAWLEDQPGDEEAGRDDEPAWPDEPGADEDTVGRVMTPEVVGAAVAVADPDPAPPAGGTEMG